MCDQTSHMLTNEQLQRTGWPDRIRPHSETQLKLVYRRGRVSEDIEETEPLCPIPRLQQLCPNVPIPFRLSVVYITTDATPSCSRALRVGENEVTKQRKGAGAVIRQSQHHARPRDARSTLKVWRLQRSQYLQTVASCQDLDLGVANGIPATTIVGAMPEREHEQATSPKQADGFAKGPGAIDGGNMLPNGTQRNHVSGNPQPRRGI